MAVGVHSVEVQATEQGLWKFIEEKGNWATLIPGYLHHEFESDQAMIWVFKGDFGFIQKAVKAKLTVTEVVENKKLAFKLEGLSDNINGDGYFEATPINDTEATLTGSLNLSAGGFLAGMINPVLENFVPDTTTQLVNAMAKALVKETV